MREEAVPQWAQSPLMKIDVTRRYVATLVTVKGEIVIELLAWDAPITVNNFMFLAREGFYDDTTFHRVGRPLIQGGDPTETGKGGPGYTIPDECRNRIKHEAGTVGMANRGEPHSSGSQFYITREARPDFDGSYNVFGRVTSGMDVVRSIRDRDISQGPQPPGDRLITVKIQEI